MEKTNILVVEDEPLIAMDIQQRLLRLGYNVAAIADSAETALQAAEQFPLDLVLMDIQLYGDRDGIETAAEIQERFNLPVVYLTAHADSATLEQAKLTHPFGYIVKPFENHDLSTAIEIALSRYQAEVAIHQAAEREKELHEIKSRFVSIVSHEFRNPLAVIQLALDIISRGDRTISPAKEELYIQRAKDSVHQMRDLLEDVLIIGESEAGNLQCHPVPIDLDDFCRNLIEELHMAVRANHSIILTIKRSIDSSQTIYCFDSKLLHYILANLLSNAVKYSLEQTDVKLNVFCQLDSVIFQIQDQGIGIPIAEQTQLFSPFYRSSNTKQIPGTGLGLSIVKQCVDAHGGTISIESKEGLGTTFTVEFHQ
ncbi:MAG TPA: ATP-binding protein [Trichocoleus sp.]|jgi:signal transduction histidine kinase